MVTKREVVETIQNRLAGGDVTDDLRGKYPYQIIAQLLNLALADIVQGNPLLKKDMAVRYSATVTCINERHTCKLPVVPLLGSQAVTYVSGNDGTWYPIRMGSIENNMMNMLKPQTDKVTCFLQGNKIVFNAKPTDSVYVEMIPSVVDMKDTDYLCAPGQETAMFQMVVQMIQQTSTRPEEVYNNAVPDTDKPTQPAK